MILLLAVAVTAGCGGGANDTAGRPPSPSAPPVGGPASAAAASPGTAAEAAMAAQMGTDPCGLVTEAEATEIMGHPMKKGEAQKQMECLMVSASGDATKSISFQVVPGTEMFDQAGAKMPAVAGVGEKAASMGDNVVIAVNRGRTFIGGVYDGANLAAGKERTLALAKKAVSRM